MSEAPMHDANDSSTESALKAQLGVRRASGIVVASGIAAVSSLAIQIIAARSLSVADNKEFLVYWSFLFAVLGIIAGTQTETTRAVAAARRHPSASGASVVKVSIMIGIAVAISLVVSSFAWAPRVAPSDPVLATAVVAVGVVAYAGAMSVSGAFAGMNLWNHYAALMSGEAVFRLALVILTVLVGFGLAGFEISSAAPTMFWLILLGSLAGCRAAKARADVGTGRLIKNNVQAMVSSAASAILITGFATMLEMTSRDEDPRILAMTMLAVSLTRSPIMIPLQAFQGVLISWVAQSRDGYLKPLMKIFSLVGVVGFVAIVVAGLLGPWIMRLLFGSSYDTPWWVLSGLMVAAVAVASLVLSGAITVGLNQHRAYAVGWVVAACISFVILFALPYTAPVRAIISLIAAPLLGVLVHLAAIVRSPK